MKKNLKYMRNFIVFILNFYFMPYGTQIGQVMADSSNWLYLQVANI